MGGAARRHLLRGHLLHGRLLRGCRGGIFRLALVLTGSPALLILVTRGWGHAWRHLQRGSDVPLVRRRRWRLGRGVAPERRAIILLQADRHVVAPRRNGRGGRVLALTGCGEVAVELLPLEDIGRVLCQASLPGEIARPARQLARETRQQKLGCHLVPRSTARQRIWTSLRHLLLGAIVSRIQKQRMLNSYC